MHPKSAFREGRETVGSQTIPPEVPVIHFGHFFAGKLSNILPIPENLRKKKKHIPKNDSKNVGKKFRKTCFFKVQNSTLTALCDRFEGFCIMNKRRKMMKNDWKINQQSMKLRTKSMKKRVQEHTKRQTESKVEKKTNQNWKRTIFQPRRKSARSAETHSIQKKAICEYLLYKYGPRSGRYLESPTL